MWLPVSRLLNVLLQLHVLLHVIRVLLLQDLALSFQISQVLQLLLVGVDGGHVFGHFVRSLSENVQLIFQLQGMVRKFL